MENAADTDWSSRRSDARENHARIIAAARALLAERGSEATIPDIAARAGVGKATVYRSFPSKQHLIDAIAQQQVAWFGDRITQALAHQDAAMALHALLRESLGQLVNDRLLMEVIAGSPAWQGAFGQDPLTSILERGKEQGSIRPEITSSDVRMLLSGVTQVARLHPHATTETWQRYGDLVMNAISIRPVPITALPSDG